MQQQIFLYVWIKSAEFELQVSTHLVRNHYPNAVIALVGDKPKTVEIDHYIPFKQVGNKRAVRVTSAILHACKELDEFVFMYDDIFLNEGFDFSTAIYKGELKKHRPNGNYHKCLVNTYRFLNYHERQAFNFECHQPQLINAKKLTELMQYVAWEDDYHLIKSLYFNWYEGDQKKLRNLKTASPTEAKKFYEEYRCFSTNSTIKPQMRAYLRNLIKL